MTLKFTRWKNAVNPLTPAELELWQMRRLFMKGLRFNKDAARYVTEEDGGGAMARRLHQVHVILGSHVQFPELVLVFQCHIATLLPGMMLKTIRPLLKGQDTWDWTPSNRLVTTIPAN